MTTPPTPTPVSVTAECPHRMERYANDCIDCLRDALSARDAELAEARREMKASEWKYTRKRNEFCQERDAAVAERDALREQLEAAVLSRNAANSALVGATEQIARLTEAERTAREALSDVIDAYVFTGEPEVGPGQKFSGARTNKIWQRAISLFTLAPGESVVQSDTKEQP